MQGITDQRVYDLSQSLCQNFGAVAELLSGKIPDVTKDHVWFSHGLNLYAMHTFENGDRAEVRLCYWGNGTILGANLLVMVADPLEELAGIAKVSILTGGRYGNDVIDLLGDFKDIERLANGSILTEEDLYEILKSVEPFIDQVNGQSG